MARYLTPIDCVCVRSRPPFGALCHQVARYLTPIDGGVRVGKSKKSEVVDRIGLNLNLRKRRWNGKQTRPTHQGFRERSGLRYRPWEKYPSNCRLHLMTRAINWRQMAAHFGLRDV